MLNESNESEIAIWIENPYLQYFRGEQYFQINQAFDSSEFVLFCKRIGERGIELVFSYTVKIHKDAMTEQKVLMATLYSPRISAILQMQN